MRSPGKVTFVLAALALLSAPLGAARAADAPKAGGAQAAPAEKKMRVAVRALVPNGADKDAASLLTSTLCTELSKVKKLDVMCADDLTALLDHTADAQGLAACEGGACLKALAKAAKADYVVGGSLGKLDSTLVLNVELIDARSSAVVKRASRKTTKPASDLLDALGDVAKELTP